MAEKKFAGAPFGIQTTRFNVNGVHPKRKIPGSFTQVAYDKNSLMEETRRLGPGAYRVMDGFSEKSGTIKTPGVDWARQLETERLAAQPHLLYHEQCEQNKMLIRKLGPGSYDIKDFIQLANEKPRSERGICESLAVRFQKGQEGFTPGPGSYGVGGVPQRAVDDKANKSFSQRGMLEMSGREANIISVGSQLGPGTYNFKSSTDELLNKVTSSKGPYQLYSGDRNKPISEGYFAAPKHTRLGPGQYDIKSFVDDINTPHNQLQGRFSKLAQYPAVPTDRIFLFSKTHAPKMKDSLGPGAYDIKEFSKPKANTSPGFLSTSRRDDKMAQKFFTRNFNPVGPGRYDIQKFEEAHDVNGHTSVFKSKRGRPNLRESRMLQERIGGNDVNAKDKNFTFLQNRAPRSITAM